MAHLLNPDHVAWSNWVSGEASRTTWFYRTLGDKGHKHSERWKQLADTMTNPDYRTNFDFQKTQLGHYSGRKLTQRYLGDKETFNRQVTSVLQRPGTQATMRVAKGVRLKGHEPTEEQLKEYELKKTKSVRALPKLGKRGDADEAIAHEIAEQLKRERAKRRQLESQLMALTYPPS